MLAFVSLAFVACNDKEDYDVYTTLSGTVVDAGNSEPLPGVTVTVSPTGKSYTTGTNGTFEFSNMETQQYTITAQKSGYQTNRTSIAGAVGETVQVTIPLTAID